MGAALVLAAPVFASMLFSFATTDSAAAEPTASLSLVAHVTAGRDGTATADLALATYDVCLADCGGYVGGDMATCALNCVGATMAALDEQIDVAPVCIRDPLMGLASCETRCTSDVGRPTDDRTCSLQCHAAAHTRIETCASTG